MTINEFYEFYDKNWMKGMRSVGLSRSAYNYWLKVGYIPHGTQLKIEILTSKVLKATKNVD